MSDCSMTIGGRAVAGTASFSVQNPATGDDLGQAPECTREQPDLAMRSGQAAQAAWQSDAAARRTALAALADAIEADLSEMALVITREQGKPLHESRCLASGFRPRPGLVGVEAPSASVAHSPNADRRLAYPLVVASRGRPSRSSAVASRPTWLKYDPERVPRLV